MCRQTNRCPRRRGETTVERARIVWEPPALLKRRMEAAAAAEGKTLAAWLTSVVTAALTAQDVEAAVAGGLRSLIRGSLEDVIADMSVGAVYAITAAALARAILETLLPPEQAQAAWEAAAAEARAAWSDPAFRRQAVRWTAADAASVEQLLRAEDTET